MFYGDGTRTWSVGCISDYLKKPLHEAGREGEKSETFRVINELWMTSVWVVIVRVIVE